MGTFLETSCTVCLPDAGRAAARRRRTALSILGFSVRSNFPYYHVNCEISDVVIGDPILADQHFLSLRRLYSARTMYLCLRRLSPTRTLSLYFRRLYPARTRAMSLSLRRLFPANPHGLFHGFSLLDHRSSFANSDLVVGDLYLINSVAPSLRRGYFPARSSLTFHRLNLKPVRPFSGNLRLRSVLASGYSHLEEDSSATSFNSILTVDLLPISTGDLVAGETCCLLSLTSLVRKLLSRDLTLQALILDPTSLPGMFCSSSVVSRMRIDKIELCSGKHMIFPVPSGQERSSRFLSVPVSLTGYHLDSGGQDSPALAAASLLNRRTLCFHETAVLWQRERVETLINLGLASPTSDLATLGPSHTSRPLRQSLYQWVLDLTSPISFGIMGPRPFPCFSMMGCLFLGQTLNPHFSGQVCPSVNLVFPTSSLGERNLIPISSYMERSLSLSSFFLEITLSQFFVSKENPMTFPENSSSRERHIVIPLQWERGLTSNSSSMERHFPFVYTSTMGCAHPALKPFELFDISCLKEGSHVNYLDWYSFEITMMFWIPTDYKQKTFGGLWVDCISIASKFTSGLFLYEFQLRFFDVCFNLCLWIARVSSRPSCDLPFQGRNAPAFQVQVGVIKTIRRLKIFVRQCLLEWRPCCTRPAHYLFERPPVADELKSSRAFSSLLSSLGATLTIWRASSLLLLSFNLCCFRFCSFVIFTHVSTSVPDWLSISECTQPIA